MAIHQRYKKMTSNDDIGGPTAQIANWITSPLFNVSKIKFLLHSPTSSYCLSSLIPPSGQIQSPTVSLDLCSHSALTPNN